MDQRSRSRTVAALAAAAALSLTAYAPVAQASDLTDVVAQVEERTSPPAVLAQVVMRTERSATPAAGAPREPVRDAPTTHDTRH